MSASYFLAALVLNVSIGHAQVVEPIHGRLQKNSTGDFVLTLDLATERLALYADKRGREADYDLPALRDLIVERFHYLVRLRAGDQDFAPTSVSLALPAAGTFLPKVIPLIATWTRVRSARAQVVTNVDSPAYRFALEVVDEVSAVGIPGPTEPMFASAVTAESANEDWWSKLVGAVGTGIGQVVLGGIEPLLFALGFYFSVRSVRDLAYQMGAFALASSVTLGLTLGGVVPRGDFSGRWIAVGIALSIVAVALGNCVNREAPGRARLVLMMGFGLVHGLGLGGALSALRWPEVWWWPSALAANIGVAIGLSLILVVAAVLTAPWWERAWYPRWIAVPASVAIGVGGLACTVGRVQAAFSISP